MPRETVFTAMRPYGDDSPAVSAVEVTWSKDRGLVQLATVCVRADDGSAFIPEPVNGLVQMTGGVGSFTGGNWFPYPPFYPSGMPYQAGDAIPLTMPHTQILERADGNTDGWCLQCRSGVHTQCVDDATVHDGTDSGDWCQCPCGQIKQQLLEEQSGRVGVEAVEGETVELVQPGGHYVQLDRKELNELIRKLKRAGAQAFGRDEW